MPSPLTKNLSQERVLQLSNDLTENIESGDVRDWRTVALYYRNLYDEATRQLKARTDERIYDLGLNALPPTLEQLLHMVAMAFGVDGRQMRGRSRTMAIANARIAYYFVARAFNYKVCMVGTFVGRTHGAVNLGVVKAQHYLETCPIFQGGFHRLPDGIKRVCIRS